MVILNILLDAGADKDRLGNSGYLVLHEAWRNGRFEIINILLEAGAERAFGTKIKIRF